MFKRFALAVVLLLLILGGIAWVKMEQKRAMDAQFAQPLPPTVIASAEVTTESWQPALRAVGSLVAVSGIDVTTEVAGLVAGVAFESGQQVNAGDLLIRLDDSLDRAALKGLEANAELARVQYQRAADLLPKRAVSQSDFDEAKANYDVARARVAEQQQVLEKKRIHAPFGGLLGLRRVDPGDYLSPGARIVSLNALDPIHVDYSLPEHEFRKLAVGMKIDVTLSAYPGERFSGEVTAIESGIDEATRSVQVRATLLNNDGRLRPGMFVEVETRHAAAHEVLTVPRTAVSFNTYGNFVYVIETGEGGAMTVHRRQVKTGASKGGRVAVSEGLQAGEQVVRAGLVKLRDGQAVTIDNSVVLSDAEVSGE